MKTSNLQLVLSSLNVEASQFMLDLITKAVLNDLEASRTQVPKEGEARYGRYPSLAASIPKDIDPSQYADIRSRLHKHQDEERTKEKELPPIESFMKSQNGGDSPRVTPKEINDLLNDVQKDLMGKYYDTEAIRHINGESAVEWEGKTPIDPPVEPSQHYRNGDGC